MHPPARSEAGTSVDRRPLTALIAYAASLYSIEGAVFSFAFVRTSPIPRTYVLGRRLPTVASYIHRRQSILVAPMTKPIRNQLTGDQFRQSYPGGATRNPEGRLFIP